jgi:hypothetical protein
MTFRARSYALLAAIVVLSVLLAGPGASALAKDWRIDTMDVLLDVQQNGDAVVDETVTFTFEGNYHYIARNIPTGNLDGLADMAVFDANGQSLPRVIRRGPSTPSRKATSSTSR